MAAERAQRWQAKRSGLTDEEEEERTREIQTRTITLWQERWATPTGKAEWTKRLLLNVERWLESGGSGRVTFHLTQALTGHGCFGSYFFRIRRAATPHCHWCPSEVDDPYHTLFKCEKYAEERSGLNHMLGKTVDPEDVENILCEEAALRWLDNPSLRSNAARELNQRRAEFIRMVTAILKEKEEEERARQAADGTRRCPRRGVRRGHQ